MRTIFVVQFRVRRRRRRPWGPWESHWELYERQSRALQKASGLTAHGGLEWEWRVVPFDRRRKR